VDFGETTQITNIIFFKQKTIICV